MGSCSNSKFGLDLCVMGRWVELLVVLGIEMGNDEYKEKSIKINGVRKRRTDLLAVRREEGAHWRHEALSAMEPERLWWTWEANPSLRFVERRLS